MEIIKRIEKDIEYYKDKSEKAMKLGMFDLAERELHIVVGLVLAINRIKESSNTKMQSIGLMDHCQKQAKKVKTWPKYKQDCMLPAGHR